MDIEAAETWNIENALGQDLTKSSDYNHIRLESSKSLHLSRVSQRCRL